VYLADAVLASLSVGKAPICNITGAVAAAATGKENSAKPAMHDRSMRGFMR
jgi:hypothetical protein